MTLTRGRIDSVHCSVLLSEAHSMTNSVDTSMRELAHRLPITVIPSHYRLYIDASELEQCRFRGTVDIDVEITETIHEIILNSAELNLSMIEFRTSSSLQGNATFDEDNEEVTMRFGQSLQKGNGCLHIEFDGIIADQLHGFYRTKDDNQIGACTQFEVSGLALSPLTHPQCVFLAWIRSSGVPLLR